MNWTKADRERQIKLEETIRVYEDDDIKVIIPTTIDSMCIYGKGTQWCVASEDERKMVHDGTMTKMKWQSTFEDYYERDVMYVFIMKKKLDYQGRNRKYIMMFEDGRFHDEKGTHHHFGAFLEKFPKLKETLISHINSGIYHEYPHKFIFIDYCGGNNKSKNKLRNPFDDYSSLQVEINGDLSQFKH